MVKQWEDLVLEHGWAYGRTGTALTGKRFLNAITVGGRHESYQESGSHRFTINHLLVPFELTAKLCRMHYLPPFVVHGTHRLTDAEVDAAAQQYREVLTLLVQGRFDEHTGLHPRYLNQLTPQSAAL
jgi:glutathione-regulated potassium-efflux system ancillary protein KefG